MKIMNIGGATAIVECNGKRMLFDPWMNEGILYGSWHHWPALNVTISDLGHLDYIYISHVHEDHCAPDTIARLNRDAEIIIMDREPEVPNFVHRFLKYNNFHFKKVHLIRPQTPQEIAPGMVVDMVTADPAHEYNYWIDSGLILKWGKHVLYNANDCAPYAGSIDYINKTYKKIDLALLPYSGGSGYPGCYSNLSHEEKMQERERIYQMRMKHFVRTVREIDPVKVMPFADQYVIGGSRRGLNKYSPHPPCPGYVQEILREEGLEDRLLLLNSGQSYHLEGRIKNPDESYRMYDESDREAYIESLAEKKYDFEKVKMRDAVPLERLFAYARARLWNIQKKQNNFSDTTLYMEVSNTGQIFQIQLNSEGVRVLRKDDRLVQPYIKISADTSLFTMLLVNHISWNMADGALFLEYDRQPNRYDQKAYAFLNYLTV